MRIKSYFAPSVQAAIAMARREFGDEVTLVTSHVTAPDARHLGEYEVVFAIEEEPPVAVPEPAALSDLPNAKAADGGAAPFTEFQSVLLEAVTPKAVPPSVQEQIAQVRSGLVALGIEASMVKALMTMVERAVQAPAIASAEIEEPVATPAVSLRTKELTAAAEPDGIRQPSIASERVASKDGARVVRRSAAEQAFLMSLSADSEKKNEKAGGALMTAARY